MKDPESDSIIFQKLWEELKLEKSVELNITNINKNGTKFINKVKIYPIYCEMKHIGYRSLRKDITNYLLSDIKEDKLKSDKKKDFTLFKDDIIAIFTHELKTPLNVIIAFSDYITRNIKKTLTPIKIDKITELSQKIYSNALIQLHMIEAILEASKIKSGHITIKEQNIKPYKILNQIIENYKSAYNKEVILNMDKELILYIDAKMCKMVFENLFSNALKYSKSKIIISLKKDNDLLVFIIEDDGNGIQEKDREIIFNMFEQVDNEIKNINGMGTGIGLYTVKHLLNICSKKVKISKSETLGGAKFTITDKLLSLKEEENI
jgi:signal transduction histidine kinase